MIFKIIAFFAIALVGLGLLLSIVTEFAPNFTGPVMCRLYQTAFAFMPVSGAAKPQLPWYCLPTDCTYKRVKLTAETDEDLSKQLAGYLVKCWECSQQGEKPRDFICYELYSEMEADEASVTRYIRSLGRCDFLPNNKIDYTDQAVNCGDENSVYWESRTVTETIIVKYDSFTHRVFVS